MFFLSRASSSIENCLPILTKAGPIRIARQLRNVPTVWINSPDLPTARLPLNFGAAEFYELYRLDRIQKRVEI